ncbi:MAG: hypothetical protein ACE37E_01180 [Hyphomicrobiales bacterium]
MTDDERRASEARRLLNEPLLIEAFTALEKRCLEDLLKLPAWRADRQRRALIDRINTMRDLRNELHAVILAGDQSSRKKPSIA